MKPKTKDDEGEKVPVKATSDYSWGGNISNRTNDVKDVSACMECLGSCLVCFSYFLVALTFPFSLFFCVKVVQQFERPVIFRLGKILRKGGKGPGMFFVLPCTDEYRSVDMRSIVYDVPPQEILTKDSVTASVDAVVYYRVVNPIMSIICVYDAYKATQLLAQTFLRNVLGTKNLSQLLSDRENISKTLQLNLDEATGPWGVKVERVEIKDVRLPTQMQRAMASEAEATREAKAKVIAAEGEHSASKTLKEAADVIFQSPNALKLRYLQTLVTISAEKNSTIIFPFLMDYMPQKSVDFSRPLYASETTFQPSLVNTLSKNTGWSLLGSKPDKA